MENTPGNSISLFKYQFFYFGFVLFLFFQVEHGAKYPVPDSCTDTKTHIVIFVMVEMVISPQWLHPFKRGVPGVDGIVHAAIHQVTKDKSREKHKRAFSQQQILQSKNTRCQYHTWNRRHKQ